MTDDRPRFSFSVVRSRRIDMQKLDYVAAALLAIALQLEVWLSTNQPHHKVQFALSGSALALLIAIRRRYPLLVVGLAIASTIPSPHSNLGTFGAAWICDMYALPAWMNGRRFWGMLLVYELVGFGSSGLRPQDAAPFMVISTIVIVFVHLVLGDRDRRLRVAERERDLAAREAVVEERARIARELHDAIAHNVSMMVVQAGAERRALDSGGETHEVLSTIEQIGRGALTEMRRLVGMLRADELEPLAPQPCLADIPTLVTQIREAGLPVDLQIDGEARELPVGIELSAYRIVQEALTNALKHAGDAHASVRIRYGADSLELEILDDGPGGPARAGGGGHGLVGMRERVALYGGRLDAGRSAAGGFTVHALLPIA